MSLSIELTIRTSFDGTTQFVLSKETDDGETVYIARRHDIQFGHSIPDDTPVTDEWLADPSEV